MGASFSTVLLPIFIPFAAFAGLLNEGLRIPRIKTFMDCAHSSMLQTAVQRRGIFSKTGKVYALQAGRMTEWLPLSP